MPRDHARSGGFDKPRPQSYLSNRSPRMIFPAFAAAIASAAGCPAPIALPHELFAYEMRDLRRNIGSCRASGEMGFPVTNASIWCLGNLGMLCHSPAVRRRAGIRARTAPCANAAGIEQNL